ncbi:MAG TPA: hypothetical protein VK636_05805 [Gemmatimonadaceae bacterium]|nr:hypothetical protein [Gemmatimonadaceae bacterium]
MLTTAVAVVAVATTSPACAQARVGRDSATRLTRFGRDLAYGGVEGLAYAGIDQLGNSPAEWGKGWRGYEKRAASNIGEFVIQESVTEGLAAVLNRPLDYRRCRCRGTGDRFAHAVAGAFTDQMPDGSHQLPIPRVVGAFVGSFAQAAWRPEKDSRTRVALLNGATSLGIGTLINLYHEFR